MSDQSAFGIGAASFGIAVMALGIAAAQVTMQVSIEQRRKGKTDRLALGDWAIDWPQLKLLIYLFLRLLHIKSPWGDPRVLSVPFITVGEMENYLRAEAAATARDPLERRMQNRLVESATNAIATGEGRYTGRMYAVRGTTRKRSEACWSDAMDMCGMTREFWPLLTGVSAQSCDGAVRPANAVTNLHSLWGYGRVMGLRKVITHENTRITLTNGGASLYLDLYAGVDRPTRLAHFSGSPNGRYMIIEEMSQQTAQSLYADAVWASGNIPAAEKLACKVSGGGLPTPKKKVGSSRKLILPTKIKPQKISMTDVEDFWDISFGEWISEVVKELKDGSCAEKNSMHLVEFVAVDPAVVSCIRTYPVGDLAPEQLLACYQALLWCVEHWWLDPYQLGSLQRYHQNVYRPRLPLLGVTLIGPEFITGKQQAQMWCHKAMESLERDTALVDEHAWEQIKAYAQRKKDNPTDNISTLGTHQHTIIVKILQSWKLMLFDRWEAMNEDAVHRSRPNQERVDVLTTLMVLVTMALVAVASDSKDIGDVEENKAMEIELG